MADKLKASDVSVSRNREGAWVTAAVVDGHRVSKTYYGYTKRDAVRLFVTEVNATRDRARLLRGNPGVRELSAYNSYEALDRFLGNREERKIANNTTAVRLVALGPEEGRAIAIILHHTKIVTFYEHGGVTLNSGGYKTVTTKQRMRQFLPPGWQMDRDWSLHGRDPYNQPLDLTFYDGMGIPTREGFPPREKKNPRARRSTRRVVFDQSDVGVHIDGSYGEDHAVKKMAALLFVVEDKLRIGPAANKARELRIELDESDAAWMEDFVDEWLEEGTSTLQDATQEGFAWEWEGGDLLLREVEAEND